MLQLHDYQVEAIDHLFSYNENLLLIPMGGGKTAIAIKLMERLIDADEAARFLVVAPLRVCRMVWPEELETWSSLTHALALGTPKQRSEALASAADVVLLNYENLAWAAKHCDLPELFDGIIFDEVSRMRAVGSVRFKAIRSSLPRFQYRLGMTGTPTSNSIMDLYGQAYAVDLGEHLGKTKQAFMNSYFERYGREPWEVRPQEDAFERITADLAPLAYSIDDARYRDQLPPLVQNVIKIDLPDRVREAYKELEKEYILALSSETIDVASPGVLSNKLRQLSQGFLYRADGSAEIFHDAKLDAIGEVIDNAETLIIAFEFKADLARLMARFPGEAMGQGGDDADLVRRWNRREVPLMYVHPASAGHGLNLQKGGNTICWYTLPWSLELYQQTIARLRRQGQAADQVWSHEIVARDTVEARCAEALHRNEAVQAYIERGLLSLARRAAAE